MAAVVRASAPEVQISEGLVSGVYTKTHSGRTVSVFHGIPYAEPPTGHLRLVFSEIDELLSLSGHKTFASSGSKTQWQKNRGPKFTKQKKEVPSVHKYWDME